MNNMLPWYNSGTKPGTITRVVGNLPSITQTEYGGTCLQSQHLEARGRGVRDSLDYIGHPVSKDPNHVCLMPLESSLFK